MMTDLASWRAEIGAELEFALAALVQAAEERQATQAHADAAQEAYVLVQEALRPLLTKGLATPLHRRREAAMASVSAARQLATNARHEHQRLLAEVQELEAAAAQLTGLEQAAEPPAAAGGVTLTQALAT